MRAHRSHLNTSPTTKARLGGLVGFYDFVAPVYGLWSVFTETKAHQWALAELREHPGRNVLEAGVGTGTEFAALAKDPAPESLCGIDLSPGMLQQARRRLGAAGGKHAWLCQADVRALPFRSGFFDTLLSCYVLDLLEEENLSRALSEFRRVLRPRGRLITLTMARQGPLFQRIWMAAYRCSPLLVGGCRPVDIATRLKQTGWQVERQEEIRQLGFRSEGVVARLRV